MKGILGGERGDTDSALRRNGFRGEHPAPPRQGIRENPKNGAMEGAVRVGGRHGDHTRATMSALRNRLIVLAALVVAALALALQFGGRVAATVLISGAAGLAIGRLLGGVRTRSRAAVAALFAAGVMLAVAAGVALAVVLPDPLPAVVAGYSVPFGGGFAAGRLAGRAARNARSG